MKKLLLVNLLVGLTLIMPASGIAPQAHVSSATVPAFSERAVDGSSLLNDESMRPGIAGDININYPPLGCSSWSLPSPVKSDTIELVARSKSGVERLIPVWVVGGYNCASTSGFFMTKLPPGEYSLTLSYCAQTPPGPGCTSLPTTLGVENRGLTNLDIFIELGCFNPAKCSWNVTVTISPPRA